MPLILRLLLLTIIGHQHRALTQAFAMMRAERNYYRSLVMMAKNRRSLRLGMAGFWCDELFGSTLSDNYGFAAG